VAPPGGSRFGTSPAAQITPFTPAAVARPWPISDRPGLTCAPSHPCRGNYVDGRAAFPAISSPCHFIGSQSPATRPGAPLLCKESDGAGPLFGNSLFGLCVCMPEGHQCWNEIPALARLGVNALRQSRGCRAALPGTSLPSLRFPNSQSGHPPAG
jgi:hypothetical protein